jgi:hypothetical protein
MSKQKTRKTAVPLRESENYIRDTCRALDAAYDQEAMWLLCSAGVFDVVSGGTNLGEAVDRLRGELDAESEQICAAQAAAAKSATFEQRNASVSKLEELYGKRCEDSLEVAYLLGIAVGRRLGPAALRMAGGAR